MEETPQSDISIFQVVVDNDDVEVAFLFAIGVLNSNSALALTSAVRAAIFTQVGGGLGGPCFRSAIFSLDDDPLCSPQRNVAFAGGGFGTRIGSTAADALPLDAPLLGFVGACVGVAFSLALSQASAGLDFLG